MSRLLLAILSSSVIWEIGLPSKQTIIIDFSYIHIIFFPGNWADTAACAGYLENRMKANSFVLSM